MNHNYSQPSAVPYKQFNHSPLLMMIFSSVIPVRIDTCGSQCSSEIIFLMQPQKLKYDLNRRLAIFYHPLFLEVVDLWVLLLGQQPKQVRISFIAFIELNLRMQKALLYNFQLKDAFMSALNDWLKEIHDCQDLKQLYQVEEIRIAAEIESLPFEAILSKEEYENFVAEFSDHDACKHLSVRINEEILSKFLFDLAATWCEHLDLELFCEFLIVLFFNISHGEKVVESSMLPLDAIQCLPLSYFEQLDLQKKVYSKSKKRNLTYFRAWCQWNYLRMEEVGENVIYRLVELYPEDDRVEDFLLVVVKAIDRVNKELSVITQPPELEQKQKTEEQEAEKLESQGAEEDNVISVKSQAEEWLENQQRELFKTQINVSAGKVYLQLVQPLPMDLFVMRYIEHDQTYVLERKVKMPIIGVQKPLIHGNLRKQLKNQHYHTQKDTSVIYISEDKEEQPQRPNVKQIVERKIKKTMNSEKVNKSFSYHTNNVLFPEFGIEDAATKPNKKFANIYSNDIRVRKRQVLKDVPVQLPKPNDIIPVPQSYRSQLHNMGLTYQQKRLEETKHLWNGVMSYEEMELLQQDERKFYHILNLLKLKFNYEHRSDYLQSCRLKLCNLSARHQMGGAITNEDKKRFHERLSRILEREKKKRRRRKGRAPRSTSFQVRTKKFKNRENRTQFQALFIQPLKNELLQFQ